MWHNSQCLATAIFVLVGTFAPRCMAENDVPDQPLPEMAEAAKDHFQPVTADELERLKSAVLDSTNALDRFLKTGAARKRNGWRKYLKWDGMHAELAKDAPDGRALSGFQKLYMASHNGLELSEFRNVRETLTLYMNALWFASQKKPEEMYQARLDDLAKRLTSFQQEPSSADALAIGRSLGWLEQARQADEVVQAVRQRYWQPNLMAQLSGRVMNAGFVEEIHEVEPVRDTIMGTSIYGTAHMNGEIGMRLIPDTERASFDILLTGQARSNNVGYNGPVTLYSTGTTYIRASKRVHVDASGFRTLGAVARCSTNSNISRIAAKCGLIRRIAWKKARKSKAEAERIASSRAARRIERQFDGKAAEMLGEANGTFSDKFQNPLQRRDSFPNTLSLSSSDSHLFVELMRAGAFQLAAPSAPPELNDDHDVAIRLHESLVGNLSETLFGGETLSDEKLIDLLNEVEMEIPEELKIGPEKDPWSITFSRDQPIRASFSSEGVTIALQGRQFTRGEQVIRAAIRISATYKLEISDKGALITQQGDVEVDFVNQKSLSVQQIALKTFLRRKFNSLFTEEISGEGLQLPGRWERAGKLLVRQLDATDGWLALGWAHVPAEAPGDAEQVAVR